MPAYSSDWTVASEVDLSPSHGKTIFEHDPTGLGATAYGNLADEFLVRHARVGPLLAAK